jgi:D-3-phosphoglycerate dehydrogenase/C-terminal binding protein
MKTQQVSGTNGVERRSKVMLIDSVRGGYLGDSRVEADVLGGRADVELIRVEEASEAAARLREAEVLIAWHHIALARSDLEQLEKCKGIVRASVGIDNIDVVAAAEMGIALENVPDYGTEEVADHTLALILVVTRNIVKVAGAAKNGDWRWQAVGGVSRLRGQRLGIVGLGRIGTAVAMRASAFGLRVAFYDPYVRTGTGKALGIEQVETLGELASGSDVLSLHVPLTPETRGMIGGEELALLPPDAIVVNTCRGEVIDTFALITALEEGSLRGAGLDVLADEPAVPTALRQHERVVLSAHSAFYSEQALLELRTKAAMAAERMLASASEAQQEVVRVSGR